ncbi:MAG TPA: hypothetical protein VL358_11355 [Caulobacteraceae bacterium]|jgi:hypothetical protein|nr:hypothetical protein [Caulobacteraceae bacterium]
MAEQGGVVDARAFMRITQHLGVEVLMTKGAAQLRVASAAAAPPQARVIDIRTGRPWTPPEPALHSGSWSFFVDMVIAAAAVSLGAWLFLKMTGG